MSRPYNFSAGPAAISEEVLAIAAAEMLDWHGCGMSVMEMSHRGKEFGQIHAQAQADLRTLLAIPEHFHLLFMQGGAWAQNAIVPLNLSRGETVDFVVTGAWSQKSTKEAQKYCRAHIAASSEDTGFTTLPAPATWQLSDRPAYIHLCSNETIHGVEFHELPDLRALGCDAPLVIDFSSHVASRPVDWSRVGLAFAGAQKNLGPAGLTLVVVREDLLDRALPTCPSAFTYQTVAQHGSMFNTPPTYAIYIASLVFQWLLRLGGIKAVEARNTAKARCLYEAIDQSALYTNPVDPACRSRMNIPFHLRDAELQDAFLAGARDRGLLQLKGHKSVGGMRASLYNAMPMEGVLALVEYLRDFEQTHG
ncbi:3-phosphoserine/phosphohydroxythreonine transaminase [Candidatus Symbiobacter mobilis]|nr:3-phosphoserine/phosphohydroxythreonine transaminase [Candidatus Symbiobacter mobilis]